MPRPPSDRVDEGYLIWSTEAERNDTRTAQIMGVPQETVSYWHRTYRWDERYLSEIQPNGEYLTGLARAGIRTSLPGMVARLRHIVEAKKPIYSDAGQQIDETWASSDRDAIQAAKLLAQIGFEDGAAQEVSLPDAMPWTPQENTPALPEGDTRARLNAIINANYRAASSRTKPGRRG